MKRRANGGLRKERLLEETEERAVERCVGI